MAGNCDSDGEKCKYNSKIPPWIWLLPQYLKRGGGGEGGGENQARAAVFQVRVSLDSSAWGSGKGRGSGTRVSQCHGIFQSLCSGFIWCMWWKLKSPQLNISFGNSLSRKKYPWNRRQVTAQKALNKLAQKSTPKSGGAKVPLAPPPPWALD